MYITLVPGHLGTNAHVLELPKELSFGSTLGVKDHLNPYY